MILQDHKLLILSMLLICSVAWSQIEPQPNYIEPAEEALQKAYEKAVESEDWNSTPPVRMRIPGVNEVWRFNEQIFAGDGPPSAQSLAALKESGISTIISIDLTIPDYPLAELEEMDYAHVPIRHGRLTTGDYLRLLRVIAQLEGYYYIHGAPGSDRSYAFASMATHVSEFRTAWRILYLLDKTGFSTDDIGLRYSALTNLPLQDLTKSRNLPPDLPAFVPPAPMIWWMRQIDESFTVLRGSSQLGWQTPPDAVGTTAEYEAAIISQMADRWLDSHPNANEDLRERMRDLRETADNLNSALRAGDSAAINESWTGMTSACMNCHDVHRDTLN